MIQDYSVRDLAITPPYTMETDPSQKHITISVTTAMLQSKHSTSNLFAVEMLKHIIHFIVWSFYYNHTFIMYGKESLVTDM